jgi:hypothetical protein
MITHSIISTISIGLSLPMPDISASQPLVDCERAVQLQRTRLNRKPHRASNSATAASLGYFCTSTLPTTLSPDFTSSKATNTYVRLCIVCVTSTIHRSTYRYSADVNVHLDDSRFCYAYVHIAQYGLVFWPGMDEIDAWMGHWWVLD